VENQAQLRATVNAAVRSNVSFYSIDARGLVATPAGGDATRASTRGTALFSGAAQRQLSSTFNDSQETLYTLAEDTGGKALLDTNDLSMGMRQAQRAFPATTSSATTRPTPPWMAATRASRCSSPRI